MGTHFYAHYNYLLELGGQPAGRPSSVSASAEVERVVSTQQIAVKHLSPLPVSPVDLTIGSGMGISFRTWIQDSLNRKYIRKDGHVIVYGTQKGAVYGFEFYQALITSIKMPALDSKSKGTEYARLTLQPERITRIAGGKDIDQKTAAKYGPPPTGFDTGHFKLSIDGLEKASTQALKVSSVSVKLGVTAYMVGSERTTQFEPSSIDDSDILVTLPGTAASSFLEWHNQTMTADNRDTRSGTLEYFAPGSNKSNFILVFDGLGIKSAQRAGQHAGDNVNVDLYCDSINLKTS